MNVGDMNRRETQVDSKEPHFPAGVTGAGRLPPGAVRGIRGNGNSRSGSRHASLCLILCLMILTACQNQFVYHPTRATEKELRQIALQVDMQPWTGPDDQRIGWRTEGSGQNRIVMFHGNAGHALHRLYFSDGMRSVGKGNDWEVFLFEYPGYGSRPGRPGEKVIMEAAMEAVMDLNRDASGKELYLAGESLGSGVASGIAAKQPEMISGIVLITPFTSLQDAGSAHFPRILVRGILRDRYDNVAALEKYNGRVGFLIAGKDEVIPAELGLSLYEQYAGPKHLWVQEQAGHNSLDFDLESSWWRELTEYLTGKE